MRYANRPGNAAIETPVEGGARMSRQPGPAAPIPVGVGATVRALARLGLRPGQGAGRLVAGMCAVFALACWLLPAPAQASSRGSLDDAEGIQWDAARYQVLEHTVCFELPRQRGMLRQLEASVRADLWARGSDFHMFARYDRGWRAPWRSPSGAYSIHMIVEVGPSDVDLTRLAAEELLDRVLDRRFADFSEAYAAEVRAHYSTAVHASPGGREWARFDNPYAGGLLVTFVAALDASTVLSIVFTYDKARIGADPEWYQRRARLSEAIVDSVRLVPARAADCGSFPRPPPG